MGRRQEPPKQKLLPLIEIKPKTRRIIASIQLVFYALVAAFWVAVALSDNRVWHWVTAGLFLSAAVAAFLRLRALWRVPSPAEE